VLDGRFERLPCWRGPFAAGRSMRLAWSARTFGGGADFPLP